MLHAKYHHFYNDTYSEYYKTRFFNKNEKNVLKKYIFCFYTNCIGTNRIYAYSACEFKWMAHSVFFQLRGTYRIFYKNNSFPDEYIAAKSRKFWDHLDHFVHLRFYDNQDRSKTENNFTPEKLKNVMFVYKKFPFRLMSSVQQVTDAWTIVFWK